MPANSKSRDEWNFDENDNDQKSINLGHPNRIMINL
jgi:hypothetical protein